MFYFFYGGHDGSKKRTALLVLFHCWNLGSSWDHSQISEVSTSLKHTGSKILIFKIEKLSLVIMYLNFLPKSDFCLCVVFSHNLHYFMLMKTNYTTRRDWKEKLYFCTWIQNNRRDAHPVNLWPVVWLNIVYYYQLYWKSSYVQMNLYSKETLLHQQLL